MTSPDTSRRLREVFVEIIKNYRELYRGALLTELELPEMTFRQFVYLDAIVRLNNPTYGELARKFKVTKPAVTAVINKLIGLGYLERVQSQEDRRIYHILISAKGSRLLSVDNNAVAKYAGYMEACLSEAELEQYIGAAEKIVAYYAFNRS